MYITTSINDHGGSIPILSYESLSHMELSFLMNLLVLAARDCVTNTGYTDFTSTNIYTDGRVYCIFVGITSQDMALTINKAQFCIVLCLWVQHNTGKVSSENLTTLRELSLKIDATENVDQLLNITTLTTSALS